MYDLSSLTLNRGSNFDFELRNRPNLPTISCSSLAGDIKDKYAFDTSEGITSIVTDVSEVVIKNVEYLKYWCILLLVDVGV